MKMLEELTFCCIFREIWHNKISAQYSWRSMTWDATVSSVYCNTNVYDNQSTFHWQTIRSKSLSIVHAWPRSKNVLASYTLTCRDMPITRLLFQNRKQFMILISFWGYRGWDQSIYQIFCIIYIKAHQYNLNFVAKYFISNFMTISEDLRRLMALLKPLTLSSFTFPTLQTLGEDLVTVLDYLHVKYVIGLGEGNPQSINISQSHYWCLSINSFPTR